MQHYSRNILYIDDEIHNLNSFTANFREYFNIHIANNIEDALEILRVHDICLIVADQRMHPVTGIEFFRSILNSHPDPIRIILTGYADILSLIDALDSGLVYQYLVKPINEVDLYFAMDRAIKFYDVKKENEALKNKLSAYIGRSAK